ncbi:ABC-2 type transport system ATP-binding protein [Melghirimyces profundicolus]|uniref:ABC-2 type transport system ATP-binding protein n=1 Tax=Melghirimyces profundicolus TaxID=1242148 RepID=A0A2T6BTL6_9BACL|nr:ABC transporter ATP-binding protein [Melghirimyces profundicolus]PTX59386.1 ABC-2 type transport system ATP-binding protein [Melghirimyces profundicolus]
MRVSLLEVKGLTGGYSNRQPVIHDLSFTVKPGEMVGLIGLNGAGKSTTIKQILGFLRPTSGEIRFNGRTLENDPTGFRKQLAYIPETPYLYPELTLREHLELTAMAYGIPEEVQRERMEPLLERFHMKKRIDWYPDTFSKGMRQKVMVLSAFLLEPSLLIVDEPFVGLDPLAIHHLLERLVKLKHRGTGILLSTHVLATAEKYCDTFVLLKEGRIALKGTLEEMRRQAGLSDASLNDIFIHAAGEEGT